MLGGREDPERREVVRTILIADDEKIERQGIRFLLEKGNFDVNVVEAVHGKAALNYLKEHKVDILFTDIKMPFIDGLTLVKDALFLYPELKCVIFSGFGEFEFAKAALQLGVNNYILKPVDMEEFNKTVKKVLDELNESEKSKGKRDRSSHLVKEHILYQLVNGKSKQMLLEQMGDEREVVENFNYNRMILIEFDHDFFEKADDVFVKDLKKEFNHPFFYINLNMQQGLLLFEPVKNLDYHVLGVRIHEFIKVHYKESCYLVISDDMKDISEISFKYNEMELKMESKFYRPDNPVFIISEKYIDKKYEEAPDEERMNKIIESIQNEDMESLRENFSLLCEKYRSQKDFSQFYVKFIFTTILKEIILKLSFTDEMKLSEEIEEIFKSQDIQSVIALMDRYVERLGEIAGSSDTRAEIAKIKSYIYANYQKDINIDALAEMVYRAPNYLRYIFKKETGCNLGKFIKAYRMKKAKDFLDHSQMKITMVCDQVGYTNVSYFCKNFKSYYGVSPEQYRKTGLYYEKDDPVFSEIETSE